VAAAALARLAFTGEPLARLTRTLAEHDALAARLAGAAAPSARAAALRGRAPLALAWLALRGGGRTRAALAWYLGLVRRPGALSGDEVVALGVPPGPAVARVLAELRDGRLDGRIRDRDMEAEHVRGWVAKGGG
jgi:tRNA nucleotidyltransferase (CCA-adding enzyme)